VRITRADRAPEAPERPHRTSHAHAPRGPAHGGGDHLRQRKHKR
jgi:hypothetical protein